ncbi:magnesium/cobalt efflux protein [Psychromonas sp. B3M02]|uniref:HlyC/CorC family transporter n=1 Tax=Psychromonas sp. B3M02 TaxID=2267226 RepID=UPI000DEB68F6|nr:CNNM domain-containing protein [Psychromonas sp. B3M02]RBW47059.1 magnesium/cobalt efflux protein [Psychromonas sp. B3M02]
MNDIPTSALFISLVILIIISAYFSSSETSMMSLNRYRLRHLAEDKNKTAVRVEMLLNKPDKLIGLILIGNNLVNILASAIATIIGQRLFGDAGIAIATGVLTFVILIFAEVTPKTLAVLYPEKIAFPSSLLLAPLQKLLSPFVWCINGISNGLLRIFGINVNEQSDHALSSDELRSVVNEAGSMIPEHHQQMLLSILELEKVTVDEIMVPRNEIAAIDINQDWETILKQLKHRTHTMTLLYRDTIDEAIGFLHARDSLLNFLKEDFSKTTLLRSVRELYFIPEGTPLNTQLIKFQQNKERMGLVVDEYGDIQGLVTLADILEEIVGDFTTTHEPHSSEEIHKQQDDSYIIEGSIGIRDLNKEMGWSLPTDGPRTLNGLILEHLETIPTSAVSTRICGYPMEIMEVENNMVKLVKILPALYTEETV